MKIYSYFQEYIYFVVAIKDDDERQDKLAANTEDSVPKNGKKWLWNLLDTRSFTQVYDVFPLLEMFPNSSLPHILLYFSSSRSQTREEELLSPKVNKLKDWILDNRSFQLSGLLSQFLSLFGLFAMTTYAHLCNYLCPFCTKHFLIFFFLEN